MTHNGTVEETDDLIGAWLNMIERAQGAWVEQPDLKALTDGASVTKDSEQWCGIFFKPEANPHTAKPSAALAIHHATADTADLLRYDYTAEARRLRLYESIDFALLYIEQGGVNVLELGQPQRPGAIHTIAGELLSKPNVPSAEPTWPFEFPKSIEDGTRFSTGASQEPHMMPSWASRVDGGIRAQHLYFLCFKKRSSGDGRMIFLDSHHWFDGQAWAPYRNPKPR